MNIAPSYTMLGITTVSPTYIISGFGRRKTSCRRRPGVTTTFQYPARYFCVPTARCRLSYSRIILGDHRWSVSAPLSL